MGVRLFGKPLVVSLCGTFLKPEMRSVYRQIVNLQRHRTVVFTERHIHPELFPFEPVVTMQKPSPAVRTKRRKQRERGNFVRRFYYKHLLKQWPPPVRPRPAPPPALPVYNDAYNLVDLLQQQQPQLVHVYYGHKAVKYLPMLRRWNGPVVVSFHGMDVKEDAYRASDPATLGEVFAHARLVLARSRSLLDRLATLGCPPAKLRLNRTAIPIEPGLLPPRHEPSDGRWIFLQACRLIPKKGLASTIQAMSQVAQRWPRAKLILAGDGPMLDELRALTEALQLQQNVEFRGWCSPEALASLYQEAHLFLHPSQTTPTNDQEGVPNALLEAMATGLPAVATRHGGIPEAVTNEVDGLLVPEKEPALLAQAILRMTNDAVLLNRLSRHAAENVASNYGLDACVTALEKCYEEAMGMPARL